MTVNLIVRGNNRQAWFAYWEKAIVCLGCRKALSDKQAEYENNNEYQYDIREIGRWSFFLG